MTDDAVEDDAVEVVEVAVAEVAVVVTSDVVVGTAGDVAAVEVANAAVAEVVEDEAVVPEETELVVDTDVDEEVQEEVVGAVVVEAGPPPERRLEVDARHLCPQGPSRNPCLDRPHHGYDTTPEPATGLKGPERRAKQQPQEPGMKQGPSACCSTGLWHDVGGASSHEKVNSEPKDDALSFPDRQKPY